MNGYKEFQLLLKLKFHPAQMGFGSAKAGDVNRIFARTKFAKNFNGLNVDHCGEDTLSGYNALMRLFLTYSAFEDFGKLFKISHVVKSNKKFTRTDYDKICVTIRKVDKSDRFFKAVSSQLTNKKLANRLKNFKEEKEDEEENAQNPFVPISAIRHAFAHGKLTPNANNANPKKVAKICNQLCDLMFELIDTEFENKIVAFQEKKKDEIEKRSGRQSAT